MRRTVICTLALFLPALAAAASAAAQERTQLERLIGLEPAEAGLYTTAQLALMKQIIERRDLTDQEKRKRTDLVRAGILPRIRFGI